MATFHRTDSKGPWSPHLGKSIRNNKMREKRLQKISEIKYKIITDYFKLVLRQAHGRGSRSPRGTLRQILL